MSILTADSSMLAALGGLKDKTEVRDATGNILGYFTPRELELKAIYEWAAKEFDSDEIQRRFREEKGLGSSLHDVMRRIQAREAR